MGLFKKKEKPKFFPDELEQFIDLALEDSILNDKELGVLYKKQKS